MLFISAQTEKLASELVAASNNEEKLRLLDNRSDSELKNLSLFFIKQSVSNEIINDFEKRINILRLAQTAAEKADYQEGVAKALHNLGTACLQHNRMAEAANYYAEALKVAESLKDKKLQADILGATALVYRTQADYDKTLEYYERSLKLLEEMPPSQEALVILNGIGAVNMLRGDYQTAEKWHIRALAASETLKNESGISDAHFHIAIVHRLRGNYADALRHYQIARGMTEALLQQKLLNDRGTLSTILRHIGGSYYLQGNLRLALDYAHQSLAIDEAIKSESGIAYSLQFIAIIRVNEKNYREALSLAGRALKLFQGLGDNEGKARSLGLLGNIHHALGEFEKSLDYFRQMLAIREASDSRDGIAIARLGIAKDLLAQGKTNDSLNFVEKALKSVEENGNRELLWQAQSLIGQVYLAQNDREKTRVAFDAAIKTIESMRGEVVGGAGESSLFFAERVKPYQQLALMFADGSDAAAAFEYAQRAKSRTLLDTLKFGRSQPKDNLTSDERTIENRLRGEIVSLNAQIAKLSSKRQGEKPTVAVLQQKLEQSRIDYQKFQNNLYAVHPELRLKRGVIEPFKTAAIAELLDDKTAFLEYLVTDDATLLFVFTKQNGKAALKTYRVAINRSELASHLARFRQMLANRNLLFGAESRELYDLLLRPAQNELRGKTNVTIMPDGALWDLPFQALQSGENRYLLDDAAISYAPSLTILRELRQKPALPANQFKKLIAFGNPVADRGNFTGLPEATRQTLVLRTLFGAQNSRIFVGDKAGEDVFKQTAEQYSILHLATHGVLDNFSPLNSYVLLAPGANGDDGRLEASEILEMNLPADMVVLSACETARGQARSGEGLIGLTWSFMIAGARTVVVSQWKVDSAGTTDLMTGFYKTLNRNPSAGKADALRQAALKMRHSDRFAHPFYWAGFVAVGDAR
ncbi:MAG: CHAT domain-containing protein [Pyrinomonadaceae bacterium]